MLQAYARIVGASAACEWTDSLGRALDDAALLQIFESRKSDGPIVVVYWIRDAMSVVALPYARPVFRRILRGIRLLPDDTPGGRATAVYFQNLGGRVYLLDLPGTDARLRQLTRVLRERTSCAFAVDGGGPYGHVGTGLIGLAAAIGARIIPIAVWCTPALIAAPHSRVRVPLPFAKMAGVLGEEIVVERKGNRRATADHVQVELERLGDLARANARAL
jgi:hypothetical protein